MKVVFIYDVCCIYKLICGVPGKSGRDQSRQDHDREPLTLFKYVHSNHTRDFCEPWEKQSSHTERCWYATPDVIEYRIGQLACQLSPSQLKVNHQNSYLLQQSGQDG